MHNGIKAGKCRLTEDLKIYLEIIFLDTGTTAIILKDILGQLLHKTKKFYHPHWGVGVSRKPPKTLFFRTLMLFCSKMEHRINFSQKKEFFQGKLSNLGLFSSHAHDMT